MEIQRRLSEKVIQEGMPAPARVAGADLAFSTDGRTATAGVVLWDTASRSVLERTAVQKPVTFPYVPGLLSFREAPAILAALRKLRGEPDVILLDGQGLAHPRGFGLACHIGVILDRPTIGCAKSILVGSYASLGVRRGSMRPLVHCEQCVGMAVRTRDGVAPLYVSVGHLTSLDAATEIVLTCCTRYRIPEPTRLADQWVEERKTLAEKQNKRRPETKRR